MNMYRFTKLLCTLFLIGTLSPAFAGDMGTDAPTDTATPASTEIPAPTDEKPSAPAGGPGLFESMLPSLGLMGGNLFEGLGKMAKNGLEGVASITHKIGEWREASLKRANEEAARKEKEIRDRRDAQLTKQTNAEAKHATLQGNLAEAERANDVGAIAQLKGQIASAANQITDAKNQIEKIDRELEKAHKEAEETRQAIAEQYNKLANGGIDAISTFARNAANGVIANATERTKALIGQRTSLMQTQLVLNHLSDPVRLMRISASVIGVFYVLKFTYNTIEDWYKVPELAQKTTMVTPVTKLWRLINDIEIFDTTLDDVVLAPEQKNEFRTMIASNHNIIDNGGHLRHWAFTGPPGTGKTTLGFAIAGELGIEAIYFNAGEVANCALDVSLRRLNQLFKKAERSSRPILIMIDEAEVLFKDRNDPKNQMSEETRILQNAIMTRLGTPQNDFMVIVMTNMIHTFDQAFISRFQGHIIEILPPNAEQRKELIEMYFDKYLVNPAFKAKSSWTDIFFGKEDPITPELDADILTPEHLAQVIDKTNKWTGRDISNFFMDAYAETLATPDAHLTKAMFDKTLDKMVVSVAKYDASSPNKRK